MHTTHTPGPWHVAGDTAFDCSIRIIPSFPKGPACIAHAMATVPATTAHANARLIAASPDLLVALEQVLPLVAQYVKLTTEGAHSYIVARAAIAKAKGGPQ